MQDFSFPSSERLKNIKVISKLFEEGKSISVYPIRAVYLEVDEPKEKLQIAVSVPKRSFGKAVDRNLLKRRMREGYRLNKAILEKELSENHGSYAIMFIYTAKDILSSRKIHKSMIKVLRQLNTNLFT